MSAIHHDIIDMYMNRTRAAGQAQSKEVRLTMNEAQELVIALAQVLSRNNALLEKVIEMSEKSARIAEQVSFTMDGGKF